MRHARKLAFTLLIAALAIGLLPIFPAAALAAESPVLTLDMQLSNITGTISVSYLSADKKTYLVSLLLDAPIRVSMPTDGGAAQIREVTRLALNAAPKHNKKRAKVSGTLVSSATLEMPGIDTALMPCALSPASVTPFKAAQSVSIGKRIALMGIQTSHQLTFSVKPATAERYVRWESNNPSVVSVDATGMLSAHAVGSATITARARNGKKAILKLQATIPATSVALDKAILSVAKGDSLYLTPSIAPENATIKSVRWTSSDTRIAKVSNAGKITARNAGAVSITATAKDGGCAASCLVIVEAKSGGHLPRIVLDGQALTLPFTKSEAQAALGGWTQSWANGGLTKLTSAKYPKTTVYFDSSGQLNSLESEDAGALITSRGLTAGSTLKDVITKGGTPAWHSAWAGSEQFLYLLLDTRLNDNPLVIELLLEGNRVRQIRISALVPTHIDSELLTPSASPSRRNAMKSIQLGKSGLVVPRIAVGCMRINGLTEQEARAFILSAMEQGANFFDHADIYGRGACETVFAKAVGMTPAVREKMILQSKCGIVPGKMFDFSKAHILSSVDGILKRLNTEYLDVLLLHRPDALMEPEEVAEAFDALHAAGKVRHFGVSNQNPGQMALLQKHLRQPIVANQLQLSIMHTPMIDAGFHVNMADAASFDHDGGALDYCRLHDITVQPWSPFQYGFFEGVFVDNPKFPELNKALAEVAEAHNITPTGVAIAWLNRHPAGMQPVTGTTNVNRLRECIQGCNTSITREEWYRIYLAAGNTLP